VHPCRIKDNPNVLEFPISVIGARPQVKLTLPEVPMLAATDPLATAGKATKTAKPGKQAAAAATPDNVIVFDRLLVDKRDTKVFTIANTSIVPFKWSLLGADKLPPEFKVGAVGVDDDPPDI
jgi:hydrocephalus-inducing protein